VTAQPGDRAYTAAFVVHLSLSAYPEPHHPTGQLDHRASIT
jgi:hypothetical protein